MSALDLQIIREAQLSGSAAEPLALMLAADLAVRGMLRAQVHAWDDRVTFARTPTGRVVGLICWRTAKWTRDAFISLGGVDANFRRQGVYRALFQDLVADLHANHPEVEQISSGHHAGNADSAAMHHALGRKLDGFTYSFDLRQRTVTNAVRTPGPEAHP